MEDDYSKAAEQETTAFWDEKARRNIDDPGRAVGVDDALRNRCIEKAQNIVVGKAIRKTVSDLNGKAESVLDFGCGVGRWIKLLDQHFPTYYGVDISPKMLDIARKEHPRKAFSRLENFQISEPDDSFCLALSVAVLHHNSYANQEVLLGELSRVTRSGGQLLLFESNGSRVSGEKHTFYPRKEADWIEATERAGFRHLDTAGTCYRFTDRLITKVLPTGLAQKRLVYRASILADSRLMPHVAPFLPSRFHERLAMRFEKN
jgi:SAM-dependent methyltransferase